MNISSDYCRLIKIRYECSGGSMNYHSEFEIEADAHEVVRTAYWDDFYFDTEYQHKDKLPEIDSRSRSNADTSDMTVREHIPMNSELWNALCEEISYLKEQLTPVEKRSTPILSDDSMMVLDGGDYSRLYLTWSIGDDEQTLQYYTPSGNRWHTVLQALHEMVRPVGRPLNRTGKTQVTDFYLETKAYSYQISPIKNSTDYYLFVYGDDSPKDRLSYEEWLKVRDFLSTLDLSGFGQGRSNDKYYLRIKYNDGINKNLKIDKAVSQQIRDFVRSIISAE